MEHRQRRLVPLAERGQKGRAVAGQVQAGVVARPSRREVLGQIFLRVAVARRPDHPDLLAAELLAERLEYTNRVGDAPYPLDAFLGGSRGSATRPNLPGTSFGADRSQGADVGAERRAHQDGMRVWLGEVPAAVNSC